MSVWSQKGDFITIPPCPKGTHQAVCYAVWDLGMQEITWKGETKNLPKVVVAWEINKKIDCPGSDFHDMSYVLSKTYTNSTHEKSNMMIDFVSLGIEIGQEETYRGFDIEEKVIVKQAMLGVIHNKGTNGTIYANISSLIPLPDGFKEMPISLPNDPPKWVLKKMNQEVMPGVDGTPPPEDDFTKGL